MAEIVPERLPDGCREFEGLLRDAITGLPEEHFGYRESIDQTPVYLVAGEGLGVLAVAVCAWKPEQVLSVQAEKVSLAVDGVASSATHPLQLCQRFLHGLQVRCQGDSGLSRILLCNGRFCFPAAPIVAFTRTLRRRLGEGWAGVASLCKDELDELRNENDPARVAARFREFLPSGPAAMTRRQVDALRALVHPEIRLSPAVATPAAENIDIAVLDLRQEKHASSLGTGHRIIYGVAGSGKTVLLLARAKIVSQQHAGDPNFRALFLCYNVTLAAWLKAQLAGYPKVEVQHFHEWAKANHIRRGEDESDEELGRRLLVTLQEHAANRRYDAAFIDEAQDFTANWFRCVLAAMKDPDEGSLVIVGDGQQGLYRQMGVRWRELGVHAQGRTTSMKFDLHRNYRNTREILELAKVFTAPPQDDAGGDEQILSLPIDPAAARRSIACPPVLHGLRHRGLEKDRVVAIVKGLLSGEWNQQRLPGPLKPEEIGVLYSHLRMQDGNRFMDLRDALSSIEYQGKALGVVWLNQPRTQNRIRVNEPALKVQTIHSAKGLQYRAVIIVWADQLPQSFRQDYNPEEERRLMFVGITRAQDFLAITYSQNELSKDSFIHEIRNSGAVIPAAVG